MAMPPRAVPPSLRAIERRGATSAIVRRRCPSVGSSLDAFCILRTGISTNDDAFIPLRTDRVCMRLRPEGPRIPVPNWLIEWSKSRDLFLILAHNPWVFRPN